MPFELADFHFIRPYLLLLLLPVSLLIIQMNYQQRQQSGWKKIISPHLLEFLFVTGEQQKSRRSNLFTAIVAVLAIVAISGPSFRQKSVPVFKTDNAQVILLDLSLSMDATDLKPSRLERAKYKLLDLLANTNEGTLGLIVYAGDAFIISPLTSDSNTIASLVPTLSTGIMPVLGSRPDLAIIKAVELLQNAKHQQGQIIWLTDGVDTKFVDKIADNIKQSGYQLSILAIGTEQGAPIPLANNKGFLKDNSGQILVPKLESAQLHQIATKTRAGYIKLTADTSDLDYLQAHQQWQAEADSANQNEQQQINRRVDDGYWLIWIALLFLLVKLLRQPGGNSASLLTPAIGLLLLLPSSNADALSWADLWLSKDQQASKAFKKKDYQSAAELFEDPGWRAAAEFKSGNFEQAAKDFELVTKGSEQVTNASEQKASPVDLYNHATSLAKSQQLQAALDTYNRLLEQDPEHQDGLFNKKIVEQLLKQQQQQNQQKDEQNKDSDQQDEQQSNQQDQKNSKSDEEKQQDEQSEQQQQNEQQTDQSEQQEQEQQLKLNEDQRDKAEKDQALEHWLEKIPDDPGGLLRRKMYREYQRRGREQKEEKLW